MSEELVKRSWQLTRETFAGFDRDENFILIDNIAKSIATAFEKGSKVLVVGNGGSSCDAMHFAEEFTGRFRKDRRPLPVICCMDPAHITCVANDYGFEDVFSRSVDAFAVPGDVLVAISTSGNSKNILNAVIKAKEKGALVVTLLGKTGGELKGKGDHEIVVAGAYPDKIQEVHMAVLHIIIETVESVLFGANSK